MCPSILYFMLQVQLQMSMPSCCNRMRYAKTRITMLITALHGGQLPPSSATRRAQFSQNLACPQGTKVKPSIGANRHTSQHRNGVQCLQQLALLAPTLRPTRSQQSVLTTARRRRRRNCRRVGWAVARRCEQRRSCCRQSYSGDVQGMRTGSDGKPLFGVEDWHENFPVCCWFDNGCHEHSAVLGRCYVLLPSVVGRTL